MLPDTVLSYSDRRCMHENLIPSVVCCYVLSRPFLRCHEMFIMCHLVQVYYIPNR
jgi:hypothetical protein